MKATVRMPPWPLAMPALAFLAYETVRLATTASAATALRASTVAALIVAVLRGHRVALSILALVNFYAALLFAVALFSGASSGYVTALMYAVLMAIAFSNVVSVFFDQPQRDFTTSEPQQ